MCLTGTLFRKLLTLCGSAGGPLSLCRGARRRQRGRERRQRRHFSTVNTFLINGSASASVSPYSPHIPDPPCKILSWRNSELLPESQVRVQVCGLTQRHGSRPCRASMRRLWWTVYYTANIYTVSQNLTLYLMDYRTSNTCCRLIPHSYLQAE